MTSKSIHNAPHPTPVYCTYSKLRQPILIEAQAWVVYTVAVLLLLFFIPIFLGLIKACIGLCCSRRIGVCGLPYLVELPWPLKHYHERSLRKRRVVYDHAGWPVHPDTRVRTRALKRTTEFFLNVIFFIAFPFVLLCCCCERICCDSRRRRRRQDEEPLLKKKRKSCCSRKKSPDKRKSSPHRKYSPHKKDSDYHHSPEKKSSCPFKKNKSPRKTDSRHGSPRRSPSQKSIGKKDSAVHESSKHHESSKKKPSKQSSRSPHGSPNKSPNESKGKRKRGGFDMYFTDDSSEDKDQMLLERLMLNDKEFKENLV